MSHRKSLPQDLAFINPSLYISLSSLATGESCLLESRNEGFRFGAKMRRSSVKHVNFADEDCHVLGKPPVSTR